MCGFLFAIQNLAMRIGLISLVECRVRTVYLSNGGGSICRLADAECGRASLGGVQEVQADGSHGRSCSVIHLKLLENAGNMGFYGTRRNP